MISAARSSKAVDAPAPSPREGPNALPSGSLLRPPAHLTRERSVEILSGPVAICVDRPVLSLDRPFTYELDRDLGGGVGSLVQVPFHGKLVRGWVLGGIDDVPQRTLRVRRLVSPVPQFDASMLELFRWVSERYVAPLASVIVRSHPPRVASEDARPGVAYDAPHADVRSEALAGYVSGDALAGYANGDALAAALRDGAGTFVVRNAPGEEAGLAVGCIAGARAAGRTAILIVPEVDPLPATAAAVLDAFGDGVACFFGGDKRSRYRMWLDIARGRYPVVVGTRSAVFAPLRDLGVVVVSREHHVLHREERSPYFHVREVAAARGRIHLSTCVLLSVMPSLEAMALDHVDIEPRERTWPPVEVVKPGPEGRAPRLVASLRSAVRAFLYEPLRGYGVARVCRACGDPAACAACGGALRSERGAMRCVVCGADARCPNCGSSNFGLARGGAERVEEWARRVASVPVTHLAPGDTSRPPRDGEVVVGGIDAVKDFGALGFDLVGILNADASLRRPGIAARERALSTWAEAAAWAAPGGRVIVQTTHPNDPAVQALVVGKPDRFARTERTRLEQAGFPVGAPVFRVVGGVELEAELGALPHRTMLVSSDGEHTLCLVALDPNDLRAFGDGIRRLAERGIVSRVEAEPHL
jgi:primosomal protein N' (replication factor Y) (superfamily II helicase)